MMIETLFVRASFLARLLEPPLGSYLESLAQRLQAQNYSLGVIRNYVYAALRFGEWLSKQGLALSAVSDQLVRRYIDQFEKRITPAHPYGQRSKLTGGLGHLVVVLQQEGVIVAPQQISSPAEQWLARYDQYLNQVGGKAAATRKKYLFYARRFWQFRFGSVEANWSSLRAEDLAGFVRQEAARLQRNLGKPPAIALRAMLRFLISDGQVTKGLEAAVPMPRQWALVSLPHHLSKEQVSQVLAVCRNTKPNELRNTAVVLLLARLGLRAGEVASLCLEDIHWAEGRLLIRAGKSHRERTLPLAEQVGQALADYLQHGRPRSLHRRVFLQCHAAYAPLTNVAISHIARRALQRADISVTHPGAHVFRHTVATELVRGGASFPQVADVLGHESLQTTAIYAKLDLDSLSQLALPWPGGEQ
jgi:site-specific recombinase XerD